MGGIVANQLGVSKEADSDLEAKKKNDASKTNGSLFFSLICHHQP